MKIRFNGPHPELLLFPNYQGYIYPNQEMDIDKELYEKKLKNLKHNDQPVWIPVIEKKEPLKQEILKQDGDLNG